MSAAWGDLPPYVQPEPESRPVVVWTVARPRVWRRVAAIVAVPLFVLGANHFVPGWTCPEARDVCQAVDR